METRDLIRSYKRHYHKVAALVRESPMSFGLTISFSSQTLRAENALPDAGKRMRLCVLMRPFLNPTSAMFLDRVWAVLKSEFAAELQDLNISEIDEARAQMKQGPISIVIDNEHYRAERVYAEISAADLFDDDDAVRRRLANLMDQPPAGHFLWNQFYSYTADSFRFASFLFDMIKRVEASAAYKASVPAEALTSGPCIYCLSNEGPFTSEEHPMPEGLGNDSAVLPPGTVCDRCNSGLLSVLDQRLLESPLFGLLRVWNVPHTKEGKLPSANYQNAHIQKTGPRHIRITTKDKSAEPTNKRWLENGMVAFTTTLQGRFDPIVFARSLYKVALGMVAFKQDAAFARSARFDRARQFIRDGEGFPNNLLMNTTCKPHHEIRLMYDVFAEGTPFAIDFFGIVFVFNLEPTPEVQLNEQIQQYLPDMKFALHSLTRADIRRPKREKRYGTDSQDSPQN